MARPAVTKCFDVDVADVSFSSQPKILDNGGKMVWISYKGSPLIVQLPKMKAPFGVSRWCDDKGNVEKYSLDLSFGGSDERVAQTLEILKKMDEKILQSGMENSMNWFKKKFSSTEVMEALYYPIVRQPKDEKYAPTIKLPLAFANGEFKFTAYDNTKDHNKVDLLDVNTKGCDVTAIIQATGLWIAGGKFGCSWKVQQLRVAPRESLPAYAFVDDDDEVDAGAGVGADDSPVDSPLLRSRDDDFSDGDL